MPPTTSPDPARVGGIDWLERTDGALTNAERRRLLRASLRALGTGMADRLRVATGRRSVTELDVPAPPDTRFAREVDAEWETQSPSVRTHARRTWAFGRALAVADGADLDEELFYAGCLLHDHGLDRATAGQDFTLRSAAAARTCADAHRSPTDVRLLEDMISAHCTPGATVEVDGVHAFYIQAGATADLLGSRLGDLTADYVGDVHHHHPRGSLATDFAALIGAEATAVPEGRFALLSKLGFTVAIRTGPSRRVP